ncbi:MAG: SlyX family protein [Steroidobacteraceae bacterium]|nr:SlyX family protein [Steroidobacteraceae bacterium]
MGDARIELLEVKLAHLERALQELSDEVARQQRELGELRARNQLLAQQLVAAHDATAASATAIEIPPHY